MESIWSTWMVITFLALAHQTSLTIANRVGVCYGLNGNNLPYPEDVVNLCKRNQIQNIRLYEPNHQILDAFRGSGIVVSLGMRNEDILGIAAVQEAANAWITTHITPYQDSISFDFVIVGNEVIPDEPMAQHVLAAMINIRTAIAFLAPSAGIKITTTVPTKVLGASYPPSAGAFKAEIQGLMQDVAAFLYYNGFPLMLNVYPYFAYRDNPSQISRNYALFTATQPIVVDGPFQYSNLFDAMVDSVYAALEKINLGDVPILIAETGWPTAGYEPYTSIDNARTYNTNLLNHIRQGGTPKRPNQQMDAFFFAMFNENLKAAGEEQNFGLFYPNMEPVYPFTF